VTTLPLLYVAVNTLLAQTMLSFTRACAPPRGVWFPRWAWVGASSQAVVRDPASLQPLPPPHNSNAALAAARLARQLLHGLYGVGTGGWGERGHSNTY